MSKQKPAPAPAPEDDGDRREQLPAVPENAGRAISGWLSVQEILARKRLIEAVMKEVMTEGEHYGPSFPGDKKLNLLKPGADTLLSVFQLVASSEYEVIDLPGGHREYRVRAPIQTMSGSTVAIGLGSCSTMEKKYRWRWASPTCPSCKRDALMKSRYGSGWYCNPKKHGCGAQVPEDQVEVPPIAKVENEDIADVYNTCLKIAKKRAIVDGTLSATGCSDVFGQDAEDVVDKDKSDGDGQRADDRPDQGRRNAGEQRPPASQQPAAAPAPTADAQIEAELAKAHKACGDAIGKPTTSKAWKGITDRTVRLGWLQRAAKAGAAIRAIRGPGADELIADLTLNRRDPDNLDGIVADLERFAAPPAAAKPAPSPAPAATAPSKPAVAGDDEPPF